MPSKLKVGSVPNKHSLLVPSKKGTPHQIFNHKVTKYTNPQKEPTHNHRIYHKNQKKLVPPPTPSHLPQFIPKPPSTPPKLQPTTQRRIPLHDGLSNTVRLTNNINQTTDSSHPIRNRCFGLTHINVGPFALPTCVG